MMFSGHRLSRLTILDLGLFDVGPGRRRIGIPGFLLHTDGGARIVVDTGFDPLYARDPQGAAARDGLGSFGQLVDFGPRQTLEGQLALLGLGLQDIDAAILTHSHIDHVGSLPLLRCPVYLTGAERALPRPLYFGQAQPMEWPDLPYREIDGETQILDGVTLIPTPGHTPGHLSVDLRLPEGRGVILAGDAINRASEPEEGYPDATDPNLAAQSGARLLQRAAASGADLIYGHDPAQWPLLPKSPAPWR